jgi:hypothetical protein
VSVLLYQTLEKMGDIPGLSFLELGTGEGINFANLKLQDKTTIDIVSPFEGSYPSVFEMTTDEYFAHHCHRNFDIIYIDADHFIANLVADFNNACDHLNPNGIILAHDLYPPCYDDSGDKNCATGYWFLKHIIEQGYNCFAEKDKFDYGVTMIFTPRKVDLLQIPHVTLEDFERFAQSNQCFLHVNEWINKLTQSIQKLVISR